MLRPGDTPLVCDRVRAQISLELDGELSQLERAMLTSHLARCTDCRVFEAEVTAFTHALRAAPLETLSVPISIAQAPLRSRPPPGRRRRRRSRSRRRLRQPGHLFRGRATEICRMSVRKVQISSRRQSGAHREQAILERAAGSATPVELGSAVALSRVRDAFDALRSRVASARFAMLVLV